MKAVLVLAILGLGLNVFAGPEDHLQQQSCYVLEVGQLGFPSAHVPQEICLESLKIDLRKNQISVYSYFQPELYKGLIVKELQNGHGGRIYFQASNVLFNQYESGCGSSEKVELILAGEVNSVGDGEVGQLQVTVDIETANDVCHSQVQRTSLNYQPR